MTKYIVKLEYRNHGYSWGLHHPYIYGKLEGWPWMVWHCHTGEVAAVCKNEIEAIDRSRPERYNESHVDHDSVA